MKRLLLVAFLLGGCPLFAQHPQAVQEPLDARIVERLRDFCGKWPGKWYVTRTRDQRNVATISGTRDVAGAPPDFDALAILDEFATLHDVDHPEAPPSFRRQVAPRTVGHSRQFSFPQLLQGVPVDGASITVTVTPDGRYYHIALSQVPAIAAPASVRPLESAAGVATHQFVRELDALNQRGFRAPGLRLQRLPQDPVVSTRIVTDRSSFVAIDGRLRRVLWVSVEAVDPENGTLLDRRQYAIDAASTDESDQAIVRIDRRLFLSDGIAKVFNPNPMRALGTFCVDPLDSTQLAPAYVRGVLRDLAPPVNSCTYLTGARVRIVEANGRAFCPKDQDVDLCLPHVPADPFTEKPDFTPFLRGRAEFAGAMAYYHLDRIQRYAEEELGYALPVVSVDLDVAPDRMYGHYVQDPAYKTPYGYIGLGRDAAFFAAEDATVVAHEYGHFLLAQLAGAAYGTGGTKGSEALAVGEGFGDYWSFAMFFDVSKGTSFENCFGEWANGRDCLRSYTALPDYSLYDPNRDDPEHNNGMIWSGTLADLFRRIPEHTTADGTIVDGHVLAASLSPLTMTVIADAIVHAARTRPDVSVQDVCDVFVQHGICPETCTQTAMSFWSAADQPASGWPVPR